MKFRELRVPEGAHDAMFKAMERGEYASGPYIEYVEDKMKEIAKSKNAVSVSSGTMGLKIALDVLGVRAGDMVIVPDLTFVVCATVIAELGAIPIFVDIDPNTLVIDRTSMINAMINHGHKVKAIMGVRLGGQELPEWIYDFDVPVIVDSAHSIDPKPEEAIMCVYSFHPSKIVSGIEGGLIATDDDAMAHKARRLRVFGFKEGTRVAHEIGYKAYMTNMSAVLIYHNLLCLDANLKRRAEIRDRYNEKLGLNRTGLGMYMVLAEKPDEVMSKVPAIQHYPMSLSRMLTGTPHNQVAHEASKNLISLPFHEWMTDSDVDLVCATITGSN